VSKSEKNDNKNSREHSACNVAIRPKKKVDLSRSPTEKGETSTCNGKKIQKRPQKRAEKFRGEVQNVMVKGRK